MLYYTLEHGECFADFRFPERCDSIYQPQIISKQWKVSSGGGDIIYDSSIFNNDNKTYLPARTTTPGYGKDRIRLEQAVETSILNYALD